MPVTGRHRRLHSAAKRSASQVTGRVRRLLATAEHTQTRSTGRSRQWFATGRASGPSHAGVAVEAEYSTPGEIFGDIVAEWWNAKLGVTLASGFVDAWFGQVQGIELSATAEQHRCRYTEVNALFAGQPTVNGEEADPDRFLMSGVLTTALFEPGDEPCVLIVGRKTTDHEPVNFDAIFACGVEGASGGYGTIGVTVPAAGTMRAVSAHPAPTTGATVSCDPTEPALIVARRRAGTAGMRIDVNGVAASSAGVTPAMTDPTRLVAFATYAAGSGLGDNCDCEAAEIVALRQWPTDEQLRTYIEDRTQPLFGVGVAP